MENNPSYEFVRDAVAKQQNLELVSHPKFNHRIKKRGFVGSIWLNPRYDGYSITATGQGKSHLYREMERLMGIHVREDAKGYKHWHTENQSDITTVIDVWGKS